VEDIDVIPMEFVDAQRFDLQGIDCTQALDLQGFHMKGSYPIYGGSMMVVDRVHSDYNLLNHHPSIENVELVGNRSMSEFGLGKAANTDILSLFKE
jgi:hypothetical protein